MASLDVIIVGAGMGGLTAAIALKELGHRVHLYERTQELRPAGSAISVWCNGVKVLKALGVGDKIEAASGVKNAMAYHDKDGKLLTRIELEGLWKDVGQRACPIARTALQQILLDAVGVEHVTLDMGCDKVEESGGRVFATFSNGRVVEGDLLIAADGTHSKIRDYVAGKEIERMYSGYVNWNGRIPIAEDLTPPLEWTLFVGEAKRMTLMPMGNEHFYVFFDVPIPKGSENCREKYREELLGHFKGWADPVQRVIERIDVETLARVEIHDTDPLATYVKGRVVLIGDAAHAMSPDLGQGGCLAMEDGYVLARCLEKSADIAAALAEYDQLRVGRGENIVLRARDRSHQIHGHVPAVTEAWYRELAEETGERVLAGLKKTIVAGPLG